MIEIGLILYWITGLLLGTIGPAGRSIQREVDDARGSPFSNEIMGRQAPSETKLFIFKITVTLGFSLLWPFLLRGALMSNKAHVFIPDPEDSKNQGLKFQYMGGHGTISCNNCDFQQSQTSFIHGINTSRSGYQCQACGKLTSSTRTQNETQASKEAEMVCECGGELSREQVLFCPDCKSTNLSYSMEYIT
jgi:hypothetical protein